MPKIGCATMAAESHKDQPLGKRCGSRKKPISVSSINQASYNASRFKFPVSVRTKSRLAIKSRYNSQS